MHVMGNTFGTQLFSIMNFSWYPYNRLASSAATYLINYYRALCYLSQTAKAKSQNHLFKIGLFFSFINPFRKVNKNSARNGTFYIDPFNTLHNLVVAFLFMLSVKCFQVEFHVDLLHLLDIRCVFASVIFL